MGLQSTEQKIKADWNGVRAWVSTHQLAAIAIALAVAWTAGHFHIPL